MTLGLNSAGRNLTSTWRPHTQASIRHRGVKYQIETEAREKQGGMELADGAGGVSSDEQGRLGQWLSYAMLRVNYKRDNVIVVGPSKR